jgi:Leucine-rich repeat (LRR) protein
MRINKFIRNHLHISFLSLLILSIVGCSINTNGTEASGTNKPPVIISLDQLHTDTDPDIWEQYFTQRGAGVFWEMLTAEIPVGYLFDFSRLTNPLKEILKQEQVNQVAAGIIHYLVCCQPDIPTLGLENLKDGQGLTSLPPEIGKLVKIKRLYLSRGKLKKLPPEIGKLNSLKELSLFTNKLKELPAEIGNLKKLNKLDLRSNKLKRLPASISEYLSRPNFKIELDTNPWFKPMELTQLDEASLEILQRSSYQISTSPESLLYMVMYFIENDLDQRTKEALQNELQANFDVDSKENMHLSQQGRQTLLKKAYEWKEGKKIIIFKTIGKNGNIPFYLDAQLPTIKKVNELFEKLREEKVYQQKNK